MAGVEGKTGNPGMKNPKKKSSTSFSVSEGKEPRSKKPMSFRPTLSLEVKINQAVEALGIKQSEWLEQAAIAYLKQNLPELTKGEETKKEITD